MRYVPDAVFRKHWGISQPTLWRYKKEGIVPTVQVGKRRKIPLRWHQDRMRIGYLPTTPAYLVAA